MLSYLLAMCMHGRVGGGSRVMCSYLLVTYTLKGSACPDMLRIVSLAYLELLAVTGNVKVTHYQLAKSKWHAREEPTLAHGQ
jgi:hypothetical protein